MSGLGKLLAGRIGPELWRWVEVENALNDRVRCWWQGWMAGKGRWVCRTSGQLVQISCDRSLLCRPRRPAVWPFTLANVQPWAG